jgi:membrane-associated phospholipid phosphatase
VTRIGVAALAGFVVLAAAFRHDPLAAWDADVATWVGTHLPAVVEWGARPFSWLGGWIGITVLSVVAGVVLLRERAWLDLGFLLAAVLGSQLVVALLKHSFDRPRPDVAPAVPLPSTASFPSGHATAGVAALGAVAVLAAERLPDARARRRLWALTVVAGLAVGASRVLLGVHYLSDVLAGWCLGLAWLAACLLARDLLRRERPAAGRT